MERFILNFGRTMTTTSEDENEDDDIYSFMRREDQETREQRQQQEKEEQKECKKDKEEAETPFVSYVDDDDRPVLERPAKRVRLSWLPKVADPWTASSLSSSSASTTTTTTATCRAFSSSSQCSGICPTYSKTTRSSRCRNFLFSSEGDKKGRWRCDWCWTTHYSRQRDTCSQCYAFRSPQWCCSTCRAWNKASSTLIHRGAQHVMMDKVHERSTKHKQQQNTSYYSCYSYYYGNDGREYQCDRCFDVFPLDRLQMNYT